MYRCAIVFVLAALVAAGLSADEPKLSVGDSRESVVAALGPPSGYVTIGSKSILHYPRGTVELFHDRLLKANLMSVAEFEAEQTRKEALAEQRRQRAEEERERRRFEGPRVRDDILDSAEFQVASAERQVTILRDFRREYPETAVGDAYARALERLEAELRQRQAQAELDERLLELERRVLVAERRAREAEYAVDAPRTRVIFRDRDYYPSAAVRYSYPFASRTVVYPAHYGHQHGSGVTLRYRGSHVSATLGYGGHGRVHGGYSRCGPSRF